MQKCIFQYRVSIQQIYVQMSTQIMKGCESYDEQIWLGNPIFT